MSETWLLRIPSELAGEICDFIETSNSVFRLALSSKRVGKLVMNSARWKRIWDQVIVRLYSKFLLNPEILSLACPNTVRALFLKAMMRCDICSVNNARRFIHDTFLCDRCHRLQPSLYSNYSNNNNNNAASVCIRSFFGGYVVCPRVHAVVVFVCGGDERRYKQTMDAIQEIQTSFAGHVAVTVEDLSCVLWQSYESIYTYFVFKIFYQTFDFSGVSYPASWIPSDYAYYLEHTVPTRFVVPCVREAHARMSVIYQNVTSKLTYITGHHDDYMVRNMIHNVWLTPGALLSTTTVADTSAWLVRLIAQQLPPDTPQRAISAESMRGCAVCTEQFGRICCATENVVRCKNCCFVSKSTCAIHTDTR